MTRRTKLGTALVVLAVGLFVAPAFFPVQSVLVHDTGPVTFDGPEQLEKQGIETVSYENMTERGQDLYVRALEAGGTYHVSPGQGASDFEYLTSEERSARDDRTQHPGAIVIERPADADLPTADEPFAGSDRQDDGRDDEHRRQVQRYDMIETSTEPPSLGSAPQLLRLLASLLAVVSLGVGGYFLSLN